jgi:hypothetical protein
VSAANAAGFYDATERAWRKDTQNERIFVGNQLFLHAALEQIAETKKFGVYPSQERIWSKMYSAKAVFRSPLICEICGNLRFQILRNLRFQIRLVLDPNLSLLPASRLNSVSN